MRKIATVVCLILPLVFASLAWAKDRCKEDREKFCSDVRPGRGRVIQCLRRHESELSEDCRDSLGRLRAKADEFKESCGKDINTICNDVKPGDGRMLGCLHENSDKLSKPCRDAINKAKEKRHEWKERGAKFRQACGDDLKKLCADVKPGEGRLMECLKKHKDQVSRTCKGALSAKGDEGEAARQGSQSNAGISEDSDEDSDD